MLDVKQKQRILDSIHVGDLITYKDITYKIIAYGKNRTTDESYFVLDNNTMLKEDVWNEIKTSK